MVSRRLERRKFVRFDLDANIRFRFLDKANVSENFNGKAKNLSAQGVCIVTEKEVPMDKDIELDISLPGRKDPVRIHGKAVWTQKIKGSGKDKASHFEAGIEIYTVDKDDENTLLKYYCEQMVDNLSKYLNF